MNKKAYTVLLAGNPNVGKSTLFNALTGMNQHTGNWSGKTVEHAVGKFSLNGSIVTLCDLPGSYSLVPCSEEERVAVERICCDSADAVIVVGDAGAPLRGVMFAMQVAELRPNVLLCLNLADEAAKRHIRIDVKSLSEALAMPVILTSARKGRGLAELRTQLTEVCDGKGSPTPILYREAAPFLARCEALVAPYCRGISPAWASKVFLENDPVRVSTLADRLSLPSECLFALDAVVREWLETHAETYFTESVQAQAEAIVKASVQSGEKGKQAGEGGVQISPMTRRLDRIVLGKWTAIPCLLFMIAGLLWISLVGANYPSSLLSRLFAWMEGGLRPLTDFLPWWADGLIWEGAWRLLTWVVAVMLPPMAIFFPLFTLLEDFGLLPRMALVTDSPFAAAGCSGKQMLTMCMSLGCTCTGVSGARIIDSPYQREIAWVTAGLTPCNGRFPLLLTLITLFGTVGGAPDPLARLILLVMLLLFSLTVTLVTSKCLYLARYRHEKSRFVMELPSYRMPQVGKVLIRSLIDRTLRILGRAAAAAAPAGVVIWLFCHLRLGDQTLLQGTVALLDPIGRVFGMDGAILTAFILGIPANEVVLPILLLCYSGSGTLLPVEGLSGVYETLVGQGWTALTALCTGIFCICHFPCITAIRTVAKESGSAKTALASALIPTAVGLLSCFVLRILSELC